jgi:Rrf2 family protein
VERPIVILSQTAVYALRATLCLAVDQNVRLRVDDIAERLDLPRNYLSKILNVLARASVLTSSRGRGGGFRLARPASEVMLREIVQRFEPTPAVGGCLLGRAVCSDLNPCVAHDRWRGVSEAVNDFFLQTSVADLAGDPLARRPP